jgi:putative transposase
MPRQARIVLPGYPHHIIQRGHNRRAVFARQADYRLYLDALQDLKKQLGCKIYAYCLMTNHVHLVIDPGDAVENLGLMMKRLAGRYTRRINHFNGRSGTVWNGRFKSSPIETDRYLLACCRYIELNPVRAKMISRPEEYPWSSYSHKVGLSFCNWLDEDPCYMELGKTRSEREICYRDWVGSSIPQGELNLIRTAIQRGQLCGSSRFVSLVEQSIGERIEPRGPGRPKL